jgi:hypothetical protein
VLSTLQTWGSCHANRFFDSAGYGPCYEVHRVSTTTGRRVRTWMFRIHAVRAGGGFGDYVVIGESDLFGGDGAVTVGTEYVFNLAGEPSCDGAEDCA